MTKFCIYQIGFVIHAIGETEEQCKRDYLNEIGEEFDGSDNCVLLRCTDEVYNYVLENGGDIYPPETLAFNMDTNVLELITEEN